MNFRVLQLFFVFILIQFFIGCTASYYKLSSADEDFEYYQGREILLSEDSNAAVFLNFEDQTGGDFLMYVEVINKQATPIIVDPAEIKMQILETNSEKFHNGYIFYALDPENKIARLNKEREDLDESYTLTTGINGVFAVAEIVSDIAGGDGEEAVYDAAKWGSILRDNEIEYEINSDQIEKDRQYWSNSVLRKTTLKKDERIGGIFYIPFDNESKKVKFIISLHESEYYFLFNQQKIDKH